MPMPSEKTRLFMPIFLTAGLTLVLWMGSKWYYQDWFEDPFKYPAKAASLTVVSFMCWSVLLSTRWRLLENYFSGLDSMYQVHKSIGKWSFYLIILHPLFLAAHKVPDIGFFFAYMWFQDPMGDRYILGLNFGVALFLLIALLVALTMWINPPYHVWKKTHEWFGLVMLLMVVHVFVVDADVAEYPLLTVWLYLLLGGALVCFIHIRFLYRFLGPRFEYAVSRIEKHADIFKFTLSPQEEKMDFKPSQFVYLAVEKKEGISPEPHPYSIASGYNLEAGFKLGIKQTGDHTATLDRLKEGDAVTVYGPYGRFSEPFLEAKRDCIFIAGGIGITPFLGMWHVALHSEERLPGKDVPEKLREVHPEMIRTWKSPRVHLFYVCKNRNQAGFDFDIRQEAILSRFAALEPMEQRGHSYELYLTDDREKITAEYMDRKVPGGARKKNIFICGPQVMMDDLIRQFFALGVRRNRIVVENFNLL
jgi:predicted ferric reductase